MSKYLLDANVFIEAKRRAYAMDLCPGFWEWLDQMNQSGIVYSIDVVADELIPAGDEISTWATKCKTRFFLPNASDAPTLAALPKVSVWATSQNYTPAAVNEFFSKADYYLVGYACANGYTVVTHEVHEPNAKKKIKIPTACTGVGVSCINPFELLRAE